MPTGQASASSLAAIGGLEPVAPSAEGHDQSAETFRAAASEPAHVFEAASQMVEYFDLLTLELGERAGACGGDQSVGFYRNVQV